MEVTVLVRTLNEETRIGRFCRAYWNATRILVADGGSTDQTMVIASQYPNVLIRHYPVKRELENGYWRNPDSDHMNWLIAWSKEYGTNREDWVLIDDCDSVPNANLKRDYWDILRNATQDYAMVVRVFLWDEYYYFPHMSKPGESHTDWESSLWGWRGDQDIWTVDAFPHYTLRIGDKAVHDMRLDANTLDLMPPYCLLHFSWVERERMEAKIKAHRESGSIKGMRHPTDFAGPLEIKPEWAVE